MPAHSGVENIVVLNTPALDGFVITHVTAGLNVPYQALYPKPEYYIRAGSGFQPTPQSVLAGMFGRVPQPHVVPLIGFQSGQIVQNVPPGMRLSFPVTIVNKGRGLAEDIFCTIEHSLPSGCGLGITNHAYERVLNSLRDGRTCNTIMVGKEMILPPGAEMLVMTLTLDVGGKGKGDLSFTAAVGSRHGPGAALTIFFPSEVVDGAYAHYTCRYETDAMRQAAERHYLEQLRGCLATAG